MDFLLDIIPLRVFNILLLFVFLLNIFPEFVRLHTFATDLLQLLLVKLYLLVYSLIVFAEASCP